MPQVIPLVVTAITTVTSAVIAAGPIAVAAFNAANIVGAAALANAAFKALQPEVRQSGASIEWEANPNAALPFAFGRVGVSGNIVANRVYGPDDMYVGFVSVVSAAGPIRSFVSFRADDTPVSFDANGKAVTSYHANVMWRRTQVGRQPEPGALPSPSGLKNGASMPGWGASYRLSGKAAYILTLAENSKRSAYRGRVPTPLNVIEGLYCWDPRLDSTYPGGSGSCRLNDPTTWVWRENPALFALKWALGLWEGPVGKGAPQMGFQVGGIGAKVENIRVDRFVELANIADANGWKAAAWPKADEPKDQVLDSFLQAAGAVYADDQGKISCIQRAAARPSVLTITSDDIAGTVEYDTTTSKIGRLNTIRPRFWSAANDWQLAPTDEVSATIWREEDGQGQPVTRSKGIDFNYVPGSKQARELACLLVAHTREGIRGTVPVRSYVDLEPGDAFDFQVPEATLNGLKCLVLNTEPDLENDTVIVTFASESDGKYAYAYGQADAPPPAPVLTPTDPTYVSPPLPEDWVIVPRPPGTGGQVPGFDLGGIVSNETATAVEFAVWEVPAGVDPNDPPPAGADWQSIGTYVPTVTQVPFTGQPDRYYWVGVTYIRNQNYSERLVIGPWLNGKLIADDVTAIGGQPVQEVLDRLTSTETLVASVGLAVDELEAVYGDTASAAASASAAAAAMADAILAKADAIEAKEDAVSAAGASATSASQAGGFKTAAETASAAAAASQVSASIARDLASESATNAAYLDAGAVYTFQNNTDAWSAVGATLTASPSGVLLVGTTADPQIARGVQIQGSRYTRIIVSLTRTKARTSGAWDGTVYYTTSGHGYSASFRKVIARDPSVGERTELTWDMASLTAGGDDWLKSTITSLRLDLDGGIGGEFTIHNIRVVGSDTAAPAKSASAAAISASNASASETASGLSAAASQTARTGAETARGQAETYRNETATSRDTAQGAAAAATAQAVLAAGSRDAAAGSADAAAGSASTATTKAGEAGASAAAASASQVSASTARDRAAESASNASYLDVGAAFTFANTVDGWGAVNGSLSPSPSGALFIQSGADPQLIRSGLAIPGSRYTRVIVTLTRTKARASGTWDGTLFYVTDSHSFSGSFRQIIARDPAVGERTELTWDMPSLTYGGTDWLTSTIRQIRLDLDQGPGGEFTIHGVRVVGADTAAPAKSASAAATSASNASASETAAGQAAAASAGSATTASTKAGEASTFASQASTSASNAAGSAQAASLSAGTAATARDQANSARDTAQGAAATAIEQASAASASAAEASISANLAAQVGQGAGYHKNPTWLDWSVGSLPPGSQSSGAVTTARNTASARYGACLEVNSNDGSNGHVELLVGRFVTPGPVTHVVVEYEVLLQGGSFRRSGLQASIQDGGVDQNAIVHLFDEHGVGVTGQTYSGAKLVKLPIAATAPNGMRLYLFNNFADLSGGASGGKNLRWQRVNVRAASSAEIEAGKVGGLEAQLSVTAAVAADAQSRLSSARFEVIAAAGGDPAQLVIRADTSGSVARLVASAISFANVVNGTIVEAMKLIGGEVFFMRPIYIDVGDKRLIVGPGGTWVLWFGGTDKTASQATRTNGFFAFGTDGKVYYGSAELGGGGGSVTGVGTVPVTLDSTTKKTIVTADMAVTADNMIEAAFSIMGQNNGPLGGNNTTFQGGWEITDRASPSGGETVVWSGTWTSTQDAEGLMSYTTSPDGFQPARRALAGSRRYSLKMWRASGTTTFIGAGNITIRKT